MLTKGCFSFNLELKNGISLQRDFPYFLRCWPHPSPQGKIWEISLVAPIAKTHNHKPHPNICSYNEVKGGGIASYFKKKNDN